jgi:hypothetical protein
MSDWLSSRPGAPAVASQRRTGDAGAQLVRAFFVATSTVRKLACRGKNSTRREAGQRVSRAGQVSYFLVCKE